MIRMKRRMKELLLIGMLALMLVGCKDDKQETEVKKSEPVQEEQTQEEQTQEETADEASGEYEETELDDI